MDETLKKGKKTKCRKFQARRIGKTDLWEGTQRDFWRQERVDASSVYFASLSIDFWPAVKRLSLTCLCGWLPW